MPCGCKNRHDLPFDTGSYEITPHISGIVFDVRDNTAIKNAEVSVIKENDNHIPDNLKTQTDENGYFDIQKTTQWGIWIVPQEPYTPLDYSLEIQADGYQEYHAELATGIWTYHPEDWQNMKIFLKPRP